MSTHSTRVTGMNAGSIIGPVFKLRQGRRERSVFPKGE